MKIEVGERYLADLEDDIGLYYKFEIVARCRYLEKTLFIGMKVGEGKPWLEVFDEYGRSLDPRGERFLIYKKSQSKKRWTY